MPRYAALPVALLMLGGLAQAQTNPTAPPAAAPNSNCTPGVRPGSPTVGSGQTNSNGQSNSNLSDQLAGSNGVICPPADVDPEMRKPAPGGGRTPVIPPPGSPGGDQKSVPK